MESAFIYLVLGEILVIALVVGIKLLFNYFENKKIKSVLDFIDKKAKENHNTDKFKECLDIIKQCNSTKE